jgi:hypothetical protein
VSEYQYYEFLALDRPLTSKQREELRQLSTRAEITATGSLTGTTGAASAATRSR